MAFKETRRGFLGSKCMPRPLVVAGVDAAQAPARAQQASRRAGVGRKVTTAGKFRIHPFVIEFAPLGHIRAVVPEALKANILVFFHAPFTQSRTITKDVTISIQYKAFSIRTPSLVSSRCLAALALRKAFD